MGCHIGSGWNLLSAMANCHGMCPQVGQQGTACSHGSEMVVEEVDYAIEAQKLSGVDIWVRKRVLRLSW